jgi:hypothetical protein
MNNEELRENDDEFLIKIIENINKMAFYVINI